MIDTNNHESLLKSLGNDKQLIICSYNFFRTTVYGGHLKAE